MGVFSIGKVVVGSLFKKPSTLMYPVIPREWEERTRGAVSINVDGCVLCGMCGRACPTNAITVDRKGSTWSIERMNCVQCRACVDNCPPKCLDMDQKYTEPGGEKVVDTFEIPPKKKPAKKDAPAKAAAPKADAKAEKKEAPKAEAKAEKKEAPKAEAKEAPKKEAKAEAAPAAAPKAEGYVAEVKEALMKDCGLSEADADKALTNSQLASRLAIFPYLKNKDAKVTAEEIKDAVNGEAPVQKAAPAKAEPAKEEPAKEEPAKEEAAPAEEPAEEAPAAADGEKGLACDLDACVLCGACAEACPVDAITVDDSWSVDKDTCIECGACVDQCPAECLELKA